jgi:hypothetical protein
VHVRARVNVVPAMTFTSDVEATAQIEAAG